MTREKREKAKIKRRAPGLVIAPPAPRPMEANHPARLLFKDAIESQKSLQESTKNNVESPTTGVPEYRSTGVFDENLKLSTATELRQESVQTNDDIITPVPEYRSTAVPELKLPAQNSPTQGVPKSRQIKESASEAGPVSKYYRKTNEVADRIDRNLTPAESKVLDHLLRLSIGFNKDWCQIRVSTLQQRTGYRSDKTIRAAITGLVMKGLISRRSHHNSPLGDEYLVHPNSGSTAVPQYRSTAVENTAVLESKITGHLNTILKDNTKNDDDPLTPLVEELRRAYRELTGADPSLNETERVRELAEVLTGELREAAGQTSHVSSPAAFLAAHLRRRFQKSVSLRRDKAPAAHESSNSGTTNPVADAQTPERRLNPDEIVEHATTLAELLGSGYRHEDATVQLAPQYHQEDWEAIWTGAQARVAGDSQKSPVDV